MLKIFLVILSLVSVLHAGDDFFKPSISTGGENFPIVNLEGEPSAIVGGCVNVITGDFVDMQQDVLIEGPEPLSLERSYCSSDPTNGGLSNGWHLNHQGLLVKLSDATVWKGAFGRELRYKKKEHKLGLSQDMLKRGITNNAAGTISGRTNLKNSFLNRKAFVEFTQK